MKFSEMNVEKVCEVVENGILDAYGHNLKAKMMSFAEKEIDEVVRATMTKLNVRSAFFNDIACGRALVIRTEYKGETIEHDVM